jgi:hypothetical protein
MALDAEVGRHASQDTLSTALAQLEHQIVLLRPVHLVRTADDGLAVIEVRRARVPSRSLRK